MSAPFRIEKSCDSCEICLEVCPVDCIYYGANQYVIDTDTCTACGACARVCPINAIHQMEEEPPAPTPTPSKSPR